MEIRDLPGVLALLNAVIRDTWAQPNAAPRSRALLAGAELGIKALQTGEFEERLAALEKRVEELNLRGDP